MAGYDPATDAVHESPELRWLWIDAIRESGREELPSTARLVLFGLSFHMIRDGRQCRVSERTLARETGLTERAVRQHISNAERRGWLYVYRSMWRPRKSGPVAHGGRDHANEYEPLVPTHVVDRFLERYEADPKKVAKHWRQTFKGAGL